MDEFIPIEIAPKRFIHVGVFTDNKSALLFTEQLIAHGVYFVANCNEDYYPRRYPIIGRDVAERNGMTQPVAPTVDAVLAAVRGGE